MSEPPVEEEQHNDEGSDEGWGDDCEVEEDDEIFQQAYEQQKQQKENKSQSIKLTLEFTPQMYEDGTLPQIQGDMSEWIPINMQPSPYYDAKKNPHFEIQCQLTKGYKHRFWFLYKGVKSFNSEKYECSDNHEGQTTHCVYIDDSGA